MFEIRRLTLGELLDESFRVFRLKFGPFLAFQAMLSVPITLAAVFVLHSIGRVTSVTLQIGLLPSFSTLIKEMLPALAFALCTYVVIGPVSLVALTKSAAATYLGRPWTFAEILRTTFALGPRAIAMGSLLLLVILVSVVVPVVLVGGGLALVFGKAAIGGDALSILVLACALLVVGFLAAAGGLTLYLRYGLSFASMVIEGLDVERAFHRSPPLMQGAYAQAGLLLSLLTSIGFLIGSVISVLFVPSLAFEGLDPSALKILVPQLIRAQMLSTVLSQVVGIFTNTYTTIAWTLFYFSRRCEKEAFDPKVM